MEALRCKMDQEISLAHQRTCEQELALKRELEEQKALLNNQLSVNQDLTTELMAERQKNTALQEVSDQNRQRCEDEVHTAKQQVEKLQHELERAMEAQATTESESKVLENNLRAEMEALRCKMDQEISLAQQRTCEQELALKRELEELRTQLNNQLSVNQDLTTELEAERLRNQPPQEEISSQEEESTEHEDENLATRPRRTSVWKRTRHLLGLRKPQRRSLSSEPVNKSTSQAAGPSSKMSMKIMSIALLLLSVCLCTQGQGRHPTGGIVPLCCTRVSSADISALVTGKPSVQHAHVSPQSKEKHVLTLKLNGPRTLLISPKMATFHARRNNQMTSQQVTDMGRDQMMALQQHIHHLNMCLRQEKANYEREKNSRAQISQELEKTKEELAKQKSLKKIFIKKDKETRRELERVQTYADPETLDTLKIANQVRDTNRHKKKKALHKDYEELQVAHLISQEKFTVELQAEKDKNAALQKELDDLRASYKEVTLKCEAEVLSRQQVENLQCELENEKKAHTDRVSENLLLENNLRAEMEALRCKMDQEISLAHQRTCEQELALKRELEEQKALLNNQLSVNQDLTTELMAEREKNTALQEVSDQNIQKCEDEVHTAKQQVEKLQHELERAMEAQATTLTESKVLENNLRAEMEALRSKMDQEISLAQQRTCEQELTLKRELEELRTQLNNQLSVNQDLTTELTAERDKNTALQEVSDQNRQRCEDEVHTAKQQVEKLQHELERAMEAQATTESESKVLENNLRAEMEALRCKMDQEISLAQQRTCEQELALKRELEELRTQLNNQLSVNQDLTTELEAERLRNQPPQEEISSQEEESTEHEDENLATRPRRTSVWKRTRHLLGLRKPQRWKRPREPSSEDVN
ncbi:hypothetical protein INR49_012164 [Caranx melampygus]|nr:hypothetical protein INR49_012164 [Caranx melampygus]